MILKTKMAVPTKKAESRRYEDLSIFRYSRLRGVSRRFRTRQGLSAMR